jgi:TM2 domain-containing membrane protein YozV
MVYMLPTILAQNKVYLGGICILNVFLGWTIIGWICALIWAVSSPKDNVDYSYKIMKTKKDLGTVIVGYYKLHLPKKI